MHTMYAAKAVWGQRSPDFDSPGTLCQPLRRVLTSPKMPTCLSPYIFLSIRLLFLKVQTEFPRSSPRQVTDFHLADSLPSQHIYSHFSINYIFPYFVFPYFVQHSCPFQEFFREVYTIQHNLFISHNTSVHRTILILGLFFILLFILNWFVVNWFVVVLCIQCSFCYFNFHRSCGKLQLSFSATPKWLLNFRLLISLSSSQVSFPSLRWFRSSSAPVPSSEGVLQLLISACYNHINN